MGENQIAYLLLALMCIAAVIIPSSVSLAPPLEVIVTVSKSVYGSRELITIHGNVTYKNQLVEEGLVAVQVEDPNNKTVALRTLPAGAVPSEPWSVEIVSLTPCDQSGNPKDSFRKGGYAFFNMTVKNNDIISERDVLMTICFYDVNLVPLPIACHQGTILPGAFHMYMPAVYIDKSVPTGNAIVYANVYTDWPKSEGRPYSPERSAAFTIVEQSGESKTSTSNTFETQSAIESGNGTFQTVLYLPNAPLGTCRVSVTAYYQGWKSFGSTKFIRVFQMVGDVFFDHEIDMSDVVSVTGVYGSKGGDPSWKPQADLNLDGEIDISDVVIVTSIYGTTY